MKDTLICVLHQPASKVRRVGKVIKKLGLNYITIKPCLGQKLPENYIKYRGLIIFGGPMSVYEAKKYKFLKYEIDCVKKFIDYDIPVFGICLGAQLIAKSLGGEVFAQSDEKHEIGYYPIFPEKGSEKIFGKKNTFFAYQWHKDTFTIPKGATLLATGSKFKNQAFVFNKKTLAVQFHPELTINTMRKWSKLAKKRNIPETQSIQELDLLAKKHESSVRNWLDINLKNLFL